MIIDWKIKAASYALVVAASFAMVSCYGDKKVNEGKSVCVAEYQQAALDQDKKNRAIEAQKQKESDEKLAKYQTEQAKAEAARNDLANLYSSLQRDTKIYRDRLSSANTNTEGALRTANAALDNYQQCKERYQQLGSESSKIAERLIGLQDQVK